MKLTKYEHACFVVEKDNQSIVVDPGSDSNNLKIPTNVTGILITHEHSDHFFPERIAQIRLVNPSAVVYGPSSIVSLIENAKILENNQNFQVGNFEIHSFVGTHDLIHPESPMIPNVSYLIDTVIYYGGDSLWYPEDIHPKIVAIPISANWMRFSDAIEMLRVLRPQYAFPTHDRLLSDIGKTVADTHMTNFTKDYGVSYERRGPSEPIEING